MFRSPAVHAEQASLMSHYMLTLPEVARELRCSRSHLYRVRAGRFPHLPPLIFIPLGRRLILSRESLRQWRVQAEAREREAQFATGLFVRRIDEDMEYLAGA